jgi:hypothetical protein
MSDPPALRPRSALHPVTGEVLDLEHAQPAELAAFRDALSDLKRLIDSTLVDVDAELARHLDPANARSSRFGDWTVEIDAPLETVWDAAELGLVLEALVQADRITRKAAEAALEPVVTHKPRYRELKKLLEHADAEVRAAVELCRSTNPRRRRRVTVRRAAPAQRRLTPRSDAQETTQ